MHIRNRESWSRSPSPLLESQPPPLSLRQRRTHRNIGADNRGFVPLDLREGYVHERAWRSFEAHIANVFGNSNDGSPGVALVLTGANAATNRILDWQNTCSQRPGSRSPPADFRRRLRPRIPSLEQGRLHRGKVALGYAAYLYQLWFLVRIAFHRHCGETLRITER